MAALATSSDGVSDPGQRSYVQIISSTKSPPAISVGIKSPSFTDSGEPAVFFSREEVSKSIQTLKLALITRCPYGRCSIPDFKSVLSQRLLLKGDYIVSVLNNRHLLLHFEDEDDYLKVIMRRSLYLKGLLYRFFKWDPHFDFNADPTFIHIWIGLPMLPVNYYYEDFLKSIAGNIGHVLRIYEPTMALTQTKEAFVCIELDILKTRPERIWIGCGAEGFWKNIIYYGVPAICSYCHKLGHEASECHKKNKSSDGQVQENPPVQQIQKDVPMQVFTKRSWRQKISQDKPINPTFRNRFSVLEEGDEENDGNQAINTEVSSQQSLSVPENAVTVEGLHGEDTLRGQQSAMEDNVNVEVTNLQSDDSLRGQQHTKSTESGCALEPHVTRTLVTEEEIRPSSPVTVVEEGIVVLAGIDSSELFPIPLDEQLQKASIIVARENIYMPHIVNTEDTHSKRKTGANTRSKTKAAGGFMARGIELIFSMILGMGNGLLRRASRLPTSTSLQEVVMDLSHPIRSSLPPQEEDRCIWAPSSFGEFSTKSTYDLVKQNGICRPPILKIWHHAFNPRASLFCWRLLNRAVAVDGRVLESGIPVVSKCNCCAAPQCEDLNHVFIGSDIANHMWRWFLPLVPNNIHLHSQLTTRIWNFIHNTNDQTPLGFISIYCLILMLWEIWKSRCAARMKLVRWIPPLVDFCLNVDGASKGNPGLCGGGGCIRDKHGTILLAFANFYGIGSSIIAETRALCNGLRMAHFLGVRFSAIYSDSSTLIQSMQQGKCSNWHIHWWRPSKDLLQGNVKTDRSSSAGPTVIARNEAVDDLFCRTPVGLRGPPVAYERRWTLVGDDGSLVDLVDSPVD
ncbi:hypothetical protein Taro_010679 [Colocasia esculenta]|uniref:Uncharacterized protein n=1 Tax=Colocasia esculenta TaxID=4460 RepID=A0A843U856_COLES|nr:hypothetical protein [Colocasia esculenta]